MERLMKIIKKTSDNFHNNLISNSTIIAMMTISTLDEIYSEECVPEELKGECLEEHILVCL